MKKIGIVTIHNSSNYGACLQSYALYKYIELKGSDCEIIDVRRPIHDDYIYEKGYSSFRNNPFTVKNRILKFIRQLARIILCRRGSGGQFTSCLSHKRFNAFNSQIHYSKVYNKLSDLKKNPPMYDLYISGSDQLWNPAQPYCLEPYFLTFVPDGKQKISFATSIGITELTDNEKKDFKKWLGSYNAVSVREQQAKDLLDSFVEREVIRVADPTFLLEPSYWNKIAIYPDMSDYILLFLLTFNGKVLKYAQSLAKQSGKKLVILKEPRLTTIDGEYTVNNDCGPLEWIGYLGRASMVITDSFHGTVFSILMGAENFYTYINPTSKRGSRIVDLLTMFGLENHILSVDFSSSYSDLTNRAIDKKHVSDVICQERNHSMDFLDKWIM